MKGVLASVQQVNTLILQGKWIRVRRNLCPGFGLLWLVESLAIIGVLEQGIETTCLSPQSLLGRRGLLTLLDNLGRTIVNVIRVILQRFWNR